MIDLGIPRHEAGTTTCIPSTHKLVGLLIGGLTSGNVLVHLLRTDQLRQLHVLTH